MKLTDDKTEILMTDSVLPSSLRVGKSDIPSSIAARKLGVIFNSQLAGTGELYSVDLLTWRSCGSVQSVSFFLSKSPTLSSFYFVVVVVLFCFSLVLSRLDYSKALRDGSRQVPLDKRRSKQIKGFKRTLSIMTKHITNSVRFSLLSV